MTSAVLPCVIYYVSLSCTTVKLEGFKAKHRKLGGPCVLGYLSEMCKGLSYEEK